MAVTYMYAKGFENDLCDIEMDNGDVCRGTITSVYQTYLVMNKTDSGKRITTQLAHIKNIRLA